MTYTVDTLVIGGGPAGASCAITLQKRQVVNLLIDKRAFPRPKTCGGLMTQKTFDLLQNTLLPGLVPDAELQKVFCEVSSTVEMYDRGKRLTRSAIAAPLRSVRRTVFDSFLIEQYRALGGTLLENETGYTLDTAQRRLTLRNGDTVSYRHLVAADGALSKTRALLGAKEPGLGFCVETYVPKSDLPEVDAVRICFGIVPEGYAWVFPSGDAYCVGLGGVYDRTHDYPEDLRSFLRLLGLEPAAYRILGAFVPVGRPVDQKKTPEDALLIGDAGGFVDPLYGEGLYFALATGIAAGEALAEGGGKAQFLRSTAPFAELIRQGARVQKQFFRPTTQKLFLRKLEGKNAFVGYFSDCQLARYGYSYKELGKLWLHYRQHAGKQPQDSEKREDTESC